MTTSNTKKVYAWLSKIILEILSKEPFAPQVILTFAVYLHLGALKAYCSELSCAGLYFTEALKKLTDPVQQKNIRDNGLVLAFDLDPAVFSEICGLIWADHQTEDFEWMGTWTRLCSSVLQNEMEMEKSFMQISAIIDDHLQLTPDSSSLIRSIIKNGLTVKSFTRLEKAGS